MKAGGRERAAGASPQFAPGRRTVKQHDRDAVRRPHLLDEDASRPGRNQMSGARRQLGAHARFAYRRRKTKRGDEKNDQQHQDQQAVGRPAQDV
jgi:hypothetical protein